jgi:IstB-like ATP binding protein
MPLARSCTPRGATAPRSGCRAEVESVLATILGHQAIKAGYRVYYTTAADLVARTTRAALDGR